MAPLTLHMIRALKPTFLQQPLRIISTASLCTSTLHSMLALACRSTTTSRDLFKSSSLLLDMLLAKPEIITVRHLPRLSIKLEPDSKEAGK